MENGTFASQEQMFLFYNIFKILTFRRRPKALVWSKGLTLCSLIDFPLHIDTKSTGLSIVYFNGSQVEFSICP